MLNEEFDILLQDSFRWKGIVSSHPDIDAIVNKYESFEEFCETSNDNDKGKTDWIRFRTLLNIESSSIDAARKFLCIEALFFYPEFFYHLGKVDDIAKAINDNEPIDGNKNIFLDVLIILGDKFGYKITDKSNVKRLKPNITSTTN